MGQARERCFPVWEKSFPVYEYIRSKQRAVFYNPARLSFPRDPRLLPHFSLRRRYTRLLNPARAQTRFLKHFTRVRTSPFSLSCERLRVPASPSILRRDIIARQTQLKSRPFSSPPSPFPKSEHHVQEINYYRDRELRVICRATKDRNNSLIIIII